MEIVARRPSLVLLGIGLALQMFVVGIPLVVIERWMFRNELAAIAALRWIATSESICREGDKDGSGSLDYMTLAQLSQEQLVDSALGSGTKQGYLFEAAPSASTPEFLWFAVASPQEPGRTGERYFCTNHAAVIFYTTTSSFELNTTDCRIASNACSLMR
jgi:hypothetical protein